VDDEHVALAHEGERTVQLGPLDVFTRCLVGEHLVHRDLFQLPLGVLVEAAHPHVADALTLHRFLLGTTCQEEIYHPPCRLSRNTKYNSILTQFTRMPDVRLAYTLDRHSFLIDLGGVLQHNNSLTS
jgi:hypothetical protein